MPSRFAGVHETATVFLATGIFVGGMWAACMRRRWQIPASMRRVLTRDVSARGLFLIALCAFGLGMLKYALSCSFDIFLMVHYFGRDGWAAPWGRGNLGGWDAFLDHLAYFGYLLPTFTVLIGVKSGWRNVRTIVVLVLSLNMLAFLMQGGGRRIPGVVGGAAIVTYVLATRRLRIRTIALSLAAVIALVFVTQRMLEYRNVGFASILGDGKAAPSVVEKLEYYHVDNNLGSFAELVHFVPSGHPYVSSPVLYLGGDPSDPPRILAGKTHGTGFDLPKAAGHPGVSLSVTLIGELYMAGGLSMVLLGGWFCGRLAGMAYDLLEMSRTAGSLLSLRHCHISPPSHGMRSGIELGIDVVPATGLDGVALGCSGGQRRHR